MRGGCEIQLLGLMTQMSQGKWREWQVIPDGTFQWPVCKELFLSIEIQKYSCFKGQTREQRRLVVCWGVGHLTQECLQSAPVPNAMPNPSDAPLAKRNIFPAKGKRLLSLFFTAAVEATPLPSQRHSQVNLSPLHLCQQDLNPQWTFLPLCPPACPQSLLPDAPLLSGSELVDLGLADCVKDHLPRSKPWTAPNSSACGLGARKPKDLWQLRVGYDTNPTEPHKQRLIRLAKRAPRLFSWDTSFINR